MSLSIPLLDFQNSEDAAEEAVSTMLRFIGEDPSREGLADTPARVVRAWREMNAGYQEDPAEILSRTFDESSDELIMLRGISFYSMCEHHLLPFYGEACVGYLPGKVVGISKLARLVNCFAHRLQVQERMTRQIAEAVETHLDARGVGVAGEHRAVRELVDGNALLEIGTGQLCLHSFKNSARLVASVRSVPSIDDVTISVSSCRTPRQPMQRW